MGSISDLYPTPPGCTCFAQFWKKSLPLSYAVLNPCYTSQNHHLVNLHYSLYQYAWRNSVRSRHLRVQSSDCLCRSSNRDEFVEWQHWNKSYQFLPYNKPFLPQQSRRHLGQNQEHQWRNFCCGLILPVRDKKAYKNGKFNIILLSRSRNSFKLSHCRTESSSILMNQS